MVLPELLAPAGNLKKLKVALDYGADAVYCGGKEFGLRAGAENLSREEMHEAIDYTRQRGSSIYVTMNIIPHNMELKSMLEYLQFLEEIGVDAVIVSDPGVLYLIERENLQLPIHLSTQANTVNWASVKFWENRGIERVILARELSRGEIEYIDEMTEAELEMFVHGSMCISYSGRCLLSNYMTGRDANRGACAQPCRWKYNLVEENRPEESYPIEEDEGGTYIMNSKDLNLLNRIPELVNLGVDALKIEGRMKSVHYVAAVTSVYRTALDKFADSPEEFAIKEKWQKELNKISHRPYTSGFFEGSPGTEAQNYKNSSYIRDYRYLGLIRGYLPDTKTAIVKVKNKISVGDELEIFGPGCQVFKQNVEELYDNQGSRIEVAPHPESLVKLRVDHEVGENYIIRREKDE
ncbi:peptidase U32 family protein [Halarsenatibacter silvermanii]|uniref:Putative protease n=1 Tax=Halarsenatibacter silvermanii TaxID=321763 RepID=A0A1G9K0R4_9FIRM|nr:U32 family peptidase [Halarsenatibacter silvermanii]SDL43389.1 putative protease [Halarsenatibacter silvermanii]